MRRIRTLEPSQRCAPSVLLSADVHGKMHTHARAHMHTPPHRQRAHKRPVSSRADLVADTRTKKAWHMQRCTLILHGRIWAGAHTHNECGCTTAICCSPVACDAACTFGDWCVLHGRIPPIDSVAHARELHSLFVHTAAKAKAKAKAKEGLAAERTLTYDLRVWHGSLQQLTCGITTACNLQRRAACCMQRTAHGGRRSSCTTCPRASTQTSRRCTVPPTLQPSPMPRHSHTNSALPPQLLPHHTTSPALFPACRSGTALARACS